MAVVRLRKYIKRYTRLSHAFDMLRRKKLVLPEPSTWDDINDQEFVRLYCEHIDAKSVFALCCTMGAERYHHWRVFTEGSTGICLEFKRRPLQAALNRMQGVTAAPVKYVKMDELNRSNGYRARDLPFIKRIGFSDEREWRILVTNDDAGDLFEIPFEIDWVHRVVLNPWMPKDIAEETRRIIRPLLAKGVSIQSSFLTNSPRWKRLGKKVAG
jgi:hypothetical protein